MWGNNECSMKQARDFAVSRKVLAMLSVLVDLHDTFPIFVWVASGHWGGGMIAPVLVK